MKNLKMILAICLSVMCVNEMNANLRQHMAGKSDRAAFVGVAFVVTGLIAGRVLHRNYKNYLANTPEEQFRKVSNHSKLARQTTFWQWLWGSK